MPINAKIVYADNTVKTVTFQSDAPSDRELIAAMGGEDKVDIHPVGDPEPWAVFKLTGGTERLVIGKWTHGSDVDGRRVSCDLDDAEAVKAARQVI
jgi:hypothetical protein